ncbi:hypothetical protein ABZX62_23040 [Streptomyces flavidovirens]|uniref:Uncharacterized protein n=1 Tax=Streptomyces flavidovirens TaxID=67298 RepID=A0ABW6RJ58_9ACTN
MADPKETEDATDKAKAIIKRELSLAEKSWKTWTENIVKKEYIKQFEATGFKSESNAAVVSANGLNAEVTGIKLEHTIWDPIADYQKAKEDARLRGLRQLPEQLRAGIDGVTRQAGLAMDKARQVEDKVADLRRDRTADLEGIADEFEDIGNRVTQLIDDLGGV